jgi:group I intron endonuclease
LNGKSYVGFTPKRYVDGVTADVLLFKRWNLHVRDAINKGSHLLFHRAIRKYGIDSFDHEILEICQSLDEALKREVFWIKELQTFGSGYNMTPGGDGVTSLSEIDRERHKKATKLAMMCPKLRLRMKLNHHAVVSTEEFKRKNRAAQKIAQNRSDVRSKRIIKNDKIETKLKRSKISKKFHANEKTKVKHRLACEVFNKKTKSKCVIQLKLDGSFVNEFSSCAEASRLTGFNRSGISNCANGLYKSMNGFLWVYKNTTL